MNREQVTAFSNEATCISCKESTMYQDSLDSMSFASEIADWEYYNQADAEDEDDVLELCEEIFESKTKCVNKMDGVDLSDYYNLYKNDIQTCKYINTISDEGIFNLQTGKITVKDGRSVNTYVDDKSATGLQVFFLLFFILGCGGMVFYVGSLRGKVDSDTTATSLSGISGGAAAMA